ncbi:MAG TPA: PP0621 family protein [Burkholderiaceae bacterium]|nr:PP0621 family protein [Burkholderiaceae bacterium]
MGKVLTWVAVLAVLWLAWRLWTISQRRVERSRAEGAGRADEPGEGDRPRVGAPEVMMRCAACGLYLPGSEARFGGGHAYCSDAHRELGPAPAGRDDG